jgi:hypothetical protein
MAAIDAAMTRFARAQDAVNALKWALARDPEGGTPLNESGTFVQSMRGALSIGLPAVTVLYKVEPECVTLIAIRFFPLEKT